MRRFIIQTYDNHKSYDWVHIIAATSLIPATVLAAALLLPLFSERAALLIMKLLLVYYGVCMFVLAIKIRRYPLTLQDRIIRLEMRLRLQRLLDPEDHWQIDGLYTDQIVPLRFASDEQLPELMRKVLDEKITDPDEIKRMVRDWTPDYNRI